MKATNNNSDGMDIRINVDADPRPVKELKEEIGGLKNTAAGSSGSVDKLGKSTQDLGKKSQQTSKDTVKFTDNVKDTGEQALITAEHLKVFAAAFLSVQAAQGVLSDLKVADDAVKTADRIGMTVDKLTSLQYAAGLAGVDVASLGTSLQFLSKNAAEAASGSGGAFDAFKRLGINIKDSNGQLKSSETLLYEVADSLGSVKSEAEQVNIAMAIFGRSGASMLNLLKGGSESVKIAMKEAFENGAVITEDFARKAEEANDEMDRMHTSIVSVRREISAAAAPIITEFADEIRETANEMRKFYQTAEGREQIEAFGEAVSASAYAVGSLGKGVAWLTETFGDALPWIIKAYVALEAFGFIGGVFGSLRGGVQGVKDLSVTWDDFGKILKGNTSNIKTTTASIVELDGAVINTAGTFATFMVLAPGMFKILAAGAALTYGTVKATSHLMENYSVWARENKNLIKSEEEWIEALKQTEKQIGYTAKSADQLKNMTDGQLSAEFKTATKEANNLRQQLTAMKLAERSKEDIAEVAEKLSQVQGYIEGIRNRGVEIRGFDDFANSSAVLADETKKANEEFDKQIQSRKQIFDLTYMGLSLTGQERAARQAESQFYDNLSTRVYNYYSAQSYAVDRQISLIKELVSQEKVSYKQIGDMSADVANKKIDAANKAKEYLLSALDAVMQKEKAAQAEILRLAQERYSIQQDLQDKLAQLNQIGMTDEEKAIDNRKRAYDDYNKALQLINQANQTQDKEQKGTLLKQAQDMLNSSKELYFNAAQFFKQQEIEKGKSAKKFQEDFVLSWSYMRDTVSVQSSNMQSSFNSAVAGMSAATDMLLKINTSLTKEQELAGKSALSVVDKIKSTIDSIDADIQLTITQSGLDSIKKAFDDIKDKTITITTVQKSVQARRWGGMVYGRLPGFGGGDKIPLLAEGGEWVHRKEAAALYGNDVMSAINSMRVDPAALRDLVASRRPSFRLPTIDQIDKLQNKISGGVSHSQPRDVVELVIDMGGAKLTTTADAEAYARFETMARRKRLCAPKKRTI